MPASNEIVGKLPGQTLLVRDSMQRAFEVYQRYLNATEHEQRDYYGHSIAYYFQSARNFWAINFDENEETLVTITTREKDAKPPFVLVYPISKSPKTSAKHCGELASRLRKMSGEKVILKKVPMKHLNSYKLEGFKAYKIGEGWNKDYRYDDDQWPEFVLSLNETVVSATEPPLHPSLEGSLDLESGTYTFRRHVRRFSQWLQKENCDVTFHPYDPAKDRDAVENMIAIWAGFRKDRHPNESLDDLTESHRCFLDNLAVLSNESLFPTESVKDKSATALVMRITKPGDRDIIVGFGFFDAVSQRTVGIYAELALHLRGRFEDASWESVARTGVPGCYEVLIAKMLKSAREQGYSFANFGGSESKSLYESRMAKFRIDHRNRMRHLVFY